SGNSPQAVRPRSQGLTFKNQIFVRFKDRRFVCPCAPDLVIRNQTTEDFPVLFEWAIIEKGNFQGAFTEFDPVFRAVRFFFFPYVVAGDSKHKQDEGNGDTCKYNKSSHRNLCGKGLFPDPNIKVFINSFYKIRMIPYFCLKYQVLWMLPGCLFMS